MRMFVFGGDSLTDSLCVFCLYIDGQSECTARDFCTGAKKVCP
jgi:hypothetical protein